MRCASTLVVCVLIGWPAVASQQRRSPEIEKAIEEFRIQTRNLGLRADSPRRARRNGQRTAAWHGRLFWNIRNDLFDAVPHEVTQTGGSKSILRRNQYGFNLSGPVLIPKLYHGGSRTFFSLSYEGVRETVGRSYLRTIPTMPERSGDFSQVVDKAGELLPILDPASTRLNPAFDPALPVSMENLQYLRDPFPGNRIPAARLDEVALDAVRHYPAPNVNIGPFFQNNYSIYAPETNKADGMRGKLDHTPRDRHRLSFSFAFSNGFDGPAKFFPTVANPGRPDRKFRSRSGSAEHTFTISPNSLNTFRFGAWMSVSENQREAGETDSAFPVYNFRPYLSMGRSYPVSRTARIQYEISDGFSWRRGKHSLRLSAEWQGEMSHSYWPQYPSGRFEFTDGLTSLPGIVNTGHAFGSFMLGLARFAESSLVEHPSYFRRRRAEVGFRDEWELKQGLTLNLGLSVAISTPRVEKYDRQSTVDLETLNPANGRPGALVFAGRDGRGRAFQPTQARPEPWMSVAWSPLGSAKMVARLSFRRRYEAIPLYSGQWGTQGFNGTPTYITQNAQLEPAVVLQEGLPAPVHPPPDLRPEAANDTIADLIDGSGELPTYDYAHLSVERQFPFAIVLTAGANYARGCNLLANNQGAHPNAIPLEDLRFRDLLNEESFNRSRRPYPQYQRFDVYSSYPVGRYQRTEGYLRLEKRTSQGLSLSAVYEFSKQLDDYAAPEGLQDYYNRRKEWSLTYWNDPHRISLTYMYELPFGPNKRLLHATDWKRHLVSGWAISGVTSYSSGDPINLLAQFNNTGGVVSALYVNAVPGVDPHVENPGPELWFNPAAFVNPPDFSIGHVSRSHPTLRNPIRQNHDLSVTKRFTLASDRAVEFMATALNFPNHANWNRPDAEIGTAESPNINAGRIIGSHGGRVIQLGLRFSF